MIPPLLTVQDVAASLSVALGLVALGGAVLGWVRFVRPRQAARRQARRDRDVVLLGRPATPANPITGEPGKEALPSIGQQVADLRAVTEGLASLVERIHHEVHTNSGSSLKDAVGRIEKRLAGGDSRFDQVDDQFADVRRRLDGLEGKVDDEVAVMNRTLANAAEASKAGLSTIQSAILAEPPADLG